MTFLKAKWQSGDNIKFFIILRIAWWYEYEIILSWSKKLLDEILNHSPMIRPSYHLFHFNEQCHLNASTFDITIIHFDSISICAGFSFWLCWSIEENKSATIFQYQIEDISQLMKRKYSEINSIQFINFILKPFNYSFW